MLNAGSLVNDFDYAVYMHNTLINIFFMEPGERASEYSLM